MKKTKAPTPDTGPALPTVDEVRRTDVMVLRADTPLLDAVREMLQRRVGAAFVVDANGGLEGQLNDLDCLQVLAGSAFESQSSAATYDEVAKGSTVSQTMRPVPATLTPGLDLFRAAQRFLETGAEALPVVDGGEVVGSMRRLDLLDAIGALVAELAARQERLEDAARTAGDRPASIERMQWAFSHLAPEQLVRLMGRTRQD